MVALPASNTGETELKSGAADCKKQKQKQKPLNLGKYHAAAYTNGNKDVNKAVGFFFCKKINASLFLLSLVFKG